MSKREADDGAAHVDKKLKGDDKKEDIAIDSELLGQQSSYGGQQSSLEQHDGASAAAAAVAAAAASSSDPANAAAAALNSQQNHQQHQLQQHLAYQNAFRRQQQQQAQQVQQAQQGQQGSSHQGGVGPGSPLSHIQPTTLPQSNNVSKPPHGSEEWHKLRRENHKEVERRRRESINQGIKELAALIPTNDTNKAQILQRGVDYIKRLKENESNNIEKWTLEKLLTEQAVAELSASNEKLKQELERAYREIEQWKRVAKEAAKDGEK